MAQLTKNSGGVHIGIPFDMVREYQLLTAPRLLTTGITQTEISILEGDYYQAYTRDTLATGTSVYYQFVTPPTKFFGFRFTEFSSSLGDSEIYMYKDPTGVVTGAAVTPLNFNSYIPRVATATFNAVTSITTPGTEFFWDFIPSGSGARPAGGSASREGFFIIAPSTPLLFKLTNNAAQDSTMRLLLEWVEVTPSVLSE